MMGCHCSCVTAASGVILVEVPVAADVRGDAQLHGARDHGAV